MRAAASDIVDRRLGTVAIPDKWRRFLEELVGNGPRIRPMGPDDVREVVRIVRLHDSDDGRAARAWFEDPHRFDAPYEDARHFVLIDPTEQRIVGVSGYGRDSSREVAGVYWLGWTYVNPYFRGRGYGARLLHVVIEHVRRFGARKLYLSTSSLESFADAVAFYRRMGFVEEGRLRDFYRDGEDQLLMGLRL